MKIPHRADCTAADDSDTREVIGGKLGDRLHQCRACKRFAVLPAEPVVDITVEPDIPSLGRYRCREHTDEPVDWRGRGCQRCAARAGRDTPQPQPHARQETPR